MLETYEKYFTTIKDNHDYIIEHMPLAMIELFALAYSHEGHTTNFECNKSLKEKHSNIKIAKCKNDNCIYIYMIGS